MKILYISYVMNQGGIENFIMSASRKLYTENEVSFLTIIHSDEKFYYEDEINNMNCNLFKVDKIKIGTLKFIIQLVKIFKKEKFDVIHSNIYVASGYVMFAAWLAGIKVRVSHSHSTYVASNFKQKINYKIAKLLVKLFSNRKIACSKEAGTSLFNKSKYDIVENGIDINKFIYDAKKRNEIREKYNIKKDDIVIGHVGRFVKVKNHEFIIRVFKECLKENKNYKLFFVGDGQEMDNIKKLVGKNNITDKVIFVGSVIDPSSYYNAMDVFIFPSLFEGLPYVLIEAQVNGLKIIASENVSRDSNLINNITFLSLNDDIKKWVNKIKINSNNRKSDLEYFEKSYYNIDIMINKLLNIYRK